MIRQGSVTDKATNDKLYFWKVFYEIIIFINVDVGIQFNNKKNI